MCCPPRLMTESIWDHQAPWLGAFVKKHVLPAAGAAFAALGNRMYHYKHPKVRARARQRSCTGLPAIGQRSWPLFGSC